MIKGLYTSAEGMIPLMAKQDQISNNLANINTTGYKKSSLVTRSFREFLKNDIEQPFVNEGTVIDEVAIDFSQGGLKQTGVPLDVAIEGEGFFTVDTPQGRRYTRNGNFSIDSDKRLVTSKGFPVIATMGDGTESIVKADGDNFSILGDGTVVVDGDNVGKLKMATFDKPYKLLREGGSLYKTSNPDALVYESNDFKLQQGFLETSNADPIRSMVDMISVFRTYEANQKAIHAQDETLGKAVNEVGRL